MEIGIGDCKSTHAITPTAKPSEVGKAENPTERANKAWGIPLITTPKAAIMSFKVINPPKNLFLKIRI
ncbi:hypothetical protein HMPREF3224_00802 [Anaerococcus hydrogenalis]|nr:hypothetical protein HMPREF3224_00802 [Anaerococcus hydrogenalis]